MLAVTAHAVCRVPASWLQDRGTTGLNQYANRWDAPMERSFAENAALTAALVRDRPIYLYPVYTTVLLPPIRSRAIVRRDLDGKWYWYSVA